MSITLFGTCRLNSIKGSNNLNNDINYTHSTKEVIQMISFLKGDLNIPPVYNRLCFRSALAKNKIINFSNTFKERFLNTEIFIIEICSMKKYIHNGFYMHHLPFDKMWHLAEKEDKDYNTRYKHYIDDTPKHILDNVIIEKQSDEEIENDIIKIQKLLYPKKIIIVSHYNSKMNGKYFYSRDHLINLLNKICKKYNIDFVNPTIALSNFTQEEIIHSDLGHYLSKGVIEFGKYMNNYIDIL